ncbi:glycosyltransferase [Sinomonas atrocyanea]|uniref:glycosyltransferase n=1 Tax=Sinomonas atrocyanea TaxID=37927 RepID=UPI003D976183
MATSATVKRLVTARALSGSRWHIRDNFLREGLGEASSDREDFLLYVGRLSAEKGVIELVAAWPEDAPDLYLAGDGPLREEVIAAAKNKINIRLLGHVSTASTQQLYSRARALIVPSIWAEPFGRVAVEAMKHGTPVLFTPGGALEDVVGGLGVPIIELSRSGIVEGLKELAVLELDEHLHHKIRTRYEDRFSFSAARRGMREILGSVLGLHG